MMVLAANSASIHQKEKEVKAARRRQARSSQPSTTRNSSRKAKNSSKAAAKMVTNDDDVRPSTKVRRPSTGTKGKVPLEDKFTDDDDNHSYDHQRQKVKSASEGVQCTRALRQRGSSGNKVSKYKVQQMEDFAFRMISSN
ncbi:hypothetical protein VaNZ11_016462 [Volvox africanus]|uniref:Shugoshin C-terminal domain-containing protein n=1 Tax=Volvox africanus TaxID=51714 RepID=A0ABQ5SMU1_9CHLO|nr:hypothetical protein VaNZ11_016462 [Volvox africanus]